ncbi:MAG: peptidyl-prolyl cis-trans isomerase [Kiritimatiellaeota bacterium]|nr:peptidyl-prolyl cis-trans isomerase [Kiritimatiellota bacterium]
MKRSVIVAALAMAGVAGLAQDEVVRSPALMDGVAAYVNSATITISEVMNEVRRIPVPPGMTSSEREAWLRKMYSTALDAMIDQRLILDAARKTKVQLQPWAVDARVREIISNNFDGDATKLYDLLAERKVSLEDWKKMQEEDLLLSAMRYQYVDKRVSVSPSEIRAEYEANKSRYKMETAVAVSIISLDPPEDASEGSVEVRGEAILAALKEGASFADMARKYSKDSKAANGGSWGKVNPEEVFHKELADIVAELRPGQVSPLLELVGHGYIVRKDEQQDMRTLTFDEAAQYVEGYLRREKSEKMFKEWTARLRKDAYIRIFELPNAKEN